MARKTLMACAVVGVLGLGILSAPAVASTITSIDGQPSTSAVVPGGVVTDEASTADVPLIEQATSSRPTITKEPAVRGTEVVPVAPPVAPPVVTDDSAASNGSGTTEPKAQEPTTQAETKSTEKTEKKPAAEKTEKKPAAEKTEKSTAESTQKKTSAEKTQKKSSASKDQKQKSAEARPNWREWAQWSKERWDKWRESHGVPTKVQPADPHTPGKKSDRRDDDRDHDWSR